ncbi:hypothetical protein SELMODRAFT_404471 [Selaginella moellendorffii]|uniref:Las1-like protein n=2 Tax=Selaginella moellendorffii TaxID=88036 RepID=D8QVF6_SELML|nr:hypothetical protein SELMODRAFT_404471 [Selaginella moellendorffii]
MKKKTKEKKNVRLVAWGSWKEWDCVRSALFSDCSSRISAAIDRITAWQARARVPIAVEITANLLSIHLRDPSMRDNIPENLVLSEQLLRLMYAMSIMRLINGVVDDKKNFRFGSVATRACQAELPHLLVSIRHDSAHGELPAISLLRMASKQALEWLKAFYWQRQRTTLHAARAHLKALLMEYVTMLQKSYVPCEDLSGHDKRQLKRVRHDRDLLLQKLIKASLAVPQEIVSILIDDALLEKDDANNEDQMETTGSNTRKLASVEDLSWKFAINKLSLAMPQILPMLALGITRRLAGLGAIADGTGYSAISEDGAKVAKISSDLEANKLTDWLEWLLERKEKRVTVKPEMEIYLENGGVHGQISQELTRELLSTCLKQELQHKVKLRLVKLVGDVYYAEKTSQLAQKLCQFQTPATTITNGNGQDLGDDGEARVVQSPAELNSLESRLTEMKRTQQEIILTTGNIKCSGAEEERRGATRDERTRREQDEQQSGEEDGLHNGSQRQRWTLARNWQACAIGMLPSSCYFGGVRPSWLVECSKELCSDSSSWEDVEEKVTCTTLTVMKDQDTRKKQKICDEEEEEDPLGTFTVAWDVEKGSEVLVINERTSLQVPGDDAGGGGGNASDKNGNGKECCHEQAVVSIKGCLLVNGKLQVVGPEVLTAIQREIHVL